MQRDRPLAVTAGGNPTVQINVTDRRRSAGERVRWNPGPPLRELRNEYASVVEPILARRPCSRPQAIAMPVFAGQKLVVVGGSSGMGRQTAADVVAAGGSAVIIGQDPGRVEDTVRALAKEGTAHGISADLTDRMQVQRVCQQLADEHADATLLVNAAGLFIPKPFLDHDGADYDSYAELDRAIFFLTQAVARGMVAGGRGGSIVNIGSMWAHQAIGATPSSAYSLAKGGLHALTRNLALELAPHQIRVNTVAPGVVWTASRSTYSTTARRPGSGSPPGTASASPRSSPRTIFRGAE
jgi:NAD(P)-dependent dehydrogenase (short-subunit alcohol dehydrogenase family)